MLDLNFQFTGTCWLWQSEKAAWHFISLPKAQSEEIQFFHENLDQKKRGWGAVKVRATIGETTWETSIFPSKEYDTYILPIKAEVRKKEQIVVESDVSVSLQIVV